MQATSKPIKDFQNYVSSDSAVRDTNLDAVASKISAVKKGYYEDHFLRYMSKCASFRPPLINRGTFCRVAIFRHAVDSFLRASLHHETYESDIQSHYDQTSQDDQKITGPQSDSSVPFCYKGCRSVNQQVQIVSIGAGSDTLWMNLVRAGVVSVHDKFVEIDYKQVVQEKIHKYASFRDLKNSLIPNDGESPAEFNVLSDKSELVYGGYSIFSGDLRVLPDIKEILFNKASLDANIPTLIISEVVLIYLKPEHSDALIHFMATSFSRAVFLNFEQIHPNDPFGIQMVRNIAERGCPLLGIHSYPTCESQSKRLQQLGWESVQVKDMLSIYNEYLNPKERFRIEQLEIFDELEEWNLLMSHYSFSWAVKGCKEPFQHAFLKYFTKYNDKSSDKDQE